MTTTSNSAGQPEAAPASTAHAAKLDPLLGRIDLIAIVSALLGACLLGIVVVVMAVIEILRLIPTLWSNPVDRWIVVAFAVALLWVVMRGKKLCVS